ncbi:MAG: tryptophan-rich sensory protein [Clostridia bacterium]|nr:tryptophan-rich sensory protein [Clostridia bacterium]
MVRFPRKGKRKCRRTIPLKTLLRCEWEQFNRRAMLIGGIVVVVLALICRIAIGSPVYVRHLLRLPDCMPSSLCLYLIGGILFFLLGALFGALVAAPTPAILRTRFRGTVLLVPLLLFRLLWFPLFFGACAPALALISLALAALCCVCAFIALVRVSRLACPVLLLNLIWLIWLICATLFVLLLN